MKKLLLALILLASPFIFFSAVQNVSADTGSKTTPTIILQKDQIIDSDYVVGGEKVNILGTINGDAYIAGGAVTVEGNINGDLLIAGGNINIQGNVTGNVRILGGNTIISGDIGENMSMLGGSVNLTDAARIGGSVVGAGGALTFYGPVSKDIRVAGGQITLGGAVGGNVFAYAKQLMVSSNANVAGDLTYKGSQKAEIASGAIIMGKVAQDVAPKNTSSQIQSQKSKFITPAISTFIIFGKTVGLLMSFIVGILFMKAFPICAQKIVDIFKKDFWKDVGIGLLIVIVAPVTIVLLFVTVIGIPFALFGGMLFALSLYIARIIASLVIGGWAIRYLSKKPHKIWSLFVGLLIYGILSMIPVFGWIFSAIFVTAGLGAIFTERKQGYAQLRAKKLI
jgi:cytoskeletal protein CcmA (bactofilin family)